MAHKKCKKKHTVNQENLFFSHFQALYPSVFSMSAFVSSHLASKAVDCLMDSKWAKAKKGEEALFTTRESVLDYCNRSAANTLCYTSDFMDK